MGEPRVEEAGQEADLQIVEEEVPTHQAEHLQARTDRTPDREADCELEHNLKPWNVQ